MTAAPKLAYDVRIAQEYVEIIFNKTPEIEGGKAFFDHVPQLIEQHPLDILVHCEKLNHLPTSWIRALLCLNQKLKTIDKQLRLIGTTDAFNRVLKQEGLHTKLKTSANLKAALVDLGVMKEKSLDVGFINPFLTAAIIVLKTQGQTQAKAGQIYKKDARERFMGDISGVIGLVSEAFTGSVVISFPAQTFLTVMSRMIGEECKEITKDIEDGAGELTNIIFGQAKVVLNERGYGIKTALPSVVTGQQHSILQMSNGPRVVIPFETDAGPFFVEICTSS